MARILQAESIGLKWKSDWIPETQVGVVNNHAATVLASFVERLNTRLSTPRGAKSLHVYTLTQMPKVRFVC